MERWFEIFEDPSKGCCRLYQKHAGQWTQLEGPSWVARVSTEDAEYVSNGATSRWCEDLFEDVVFRDDSGALRVKVGDANLSLLQCLPQLT